MNTEMTALILINLVVAVGYVYGCYFSRNED